MNFLNLKVQGLKKKEKTVYSKKVWVWSNKFKIAEIRMHQLSESASCATEAGSLSCDRKQRHFNSVTESWRWEAWITIRSKTTVCFDFHLESLLRKFRHVQLSAANSKKKELGYRSSRKFSPVSCHESPYSSRTAVWPVFQTVQLHQIHLVLRERHFYLQLLSSFTHSSVRTSGKKVIITYTLELPSTFYQWSWNNQRMSFVFVPV